MLNIVGRIVNMRGKPDFYIITNGMTVKPIPVDVVYREYLAGHLPYVESMDAAGKISFKNIQDDLIPTMSNNPKYVQNTCSVLSVSKKNGRQTGAIVFNCGGAIDIKFVDIENMGVYMGGRFFNVKLVNGFIVPKNKDLPIKGCTESENVEKSQLQYRLVKGGIEIIGVSDKTIQQIVIPETIANIPVVGLADGTFKSFENLKSITLPSTLKYIGDRAFTDCKKLQSIIIPANLEKLGEYVFLGCASLTGIVFGGKLAEIPSGACMDCINLKSVKLYPEVKSIGNNAFSNCRSLTEFDMPNTVERMGFSVFRNCISMKRVRLSQRLREIGYEAFYACGKLTSIDLPDSLIKLERDTFAYCGLQTIKLSNSILSIPPSCFRCCTFLQSVTLPKDVRTIHADAFNMCTALKQVILPSQLEKIGVDAFANCSALEQVKVPDGVIAIGNTVFSSCTNLRTVSIPDSVLQITDNTVADCPSVTIYTDNPYVKKVYKGSGVRLNPLSKLPTE